MDLNTILKNTKEKSDRVKRTRQPVYIANEDRPYEYKEMNSSVKNNQNKTSNKPTTNRKQTDNKLATKRKQSDNKLVTKCKQSGNKVASKPITKVATKWQQSGNKVATNRPFSALVGLQRFIVLLIYEECKKSRSKITDPLTIEYIAKQLNSYKNTVKTSIYRLEIKGYLLRNEYKNGRGGWTRYELPKEVFHELLQNETGNKLATNWQQTVNKVVSKVVTEPITSPSSSSSIYKTTTTELPDDWLKINLTDTNEFGFTHSHLLQLYKTGEFTSKIIEDSIKHFLFDLQQNNKAKEIKTNSLSYFMGILRRSGIYAAPENYESSKDRAMRLYLEKEKVIQEKRASLENELFSVEFNKWSNHLSEEDKNQIIPDEAKKINLNGPKIAALRLHFKQTFWPELRKTIIGNIETEK